MEVARYWRIGKMLDGKDLADRRPKILNKTELVELKKSVPLELHVMKTSYLGKTVAREVVVVLGDRSVSLKLIGSVKEFAKGAMKKIAGLVGMDEFEGVVESTLSVVAIYGDKLETQVTEDFSNKAFEEVTTWRNAWKRDPALVVRQVGRELVEGKEILDTDEMLEWLDAENLENG